MGAIGLALGLAVAKARNYSTVEQHHCLAWSSGLASSTCAQQRPSAITRCAFCWAGSGGVAFNGSGAVVNLAQAT